MNINAAADEIKSQHGKAGSNVPSYVEVTAAGMAASALAAESNDGARTLLDLAAPRIGSILDSRGSVQGEVGHEGYTDDGSPKISGQAAPGVLVHIYDGVMLIGRVPATASGSWSFTPRIPLAEGRHELSIAYEYANGDISDFSDAHVIHVDKSNPELPEILGMVDDEGRITGVVAEDDIIDDARPTITGTAEPHATVIVYDKGKEIGRATVDAKGDWSFTPETALKDGTHLFSYSAVDRAGNQSEFSEPFEFIVDTRAERVTIHMAEDDAGSVTGLVYSGGVTDDTTPTLMGTATAGGIVKLYEGGVLLGQTTAEVDGTWSFMPNVPLADGAHTLTATVTLPAKGESPLSKPFELVVQTVALGQPVIDAVHDNVGAVQGLLGKGAHTDDARPALSGRAEAGSTVHVYDNLVLLGTTLAGANGTWAFTPSTPLTDGVHGFTVVAVSDAGNSSTRSPEYAVTVDTTAPNQPVIDTVYDDVGGTTGNLVSGGSTDDTRPDIGGKAEAGSTVVLFDGGVEIGRVQADAGGRWSFTPPIPFLQGVHSLVVQAIDSAGNKSLPSDAFGLTVVSGGDDQPSMLHPKGGRVSLSLLVDVSGSMTGYITEAKAAAISSVDAHLLVGAEVSVSLYAEGKKGEYRISNFNDPSYALFVQKVNSLSNGSYAFASDVARANSDIKSAVANGLAAGYSAKQVLYIGDAGNSFSSGDVTSWKATLAAGFGSIGIDVWHVAIPVLYPQYQNYIDGFTNGKPALVAPDASDLASALLMKVVGDHVEGNVLENDGDIVRDGSERISSIALNDQTFSVGSDNRLVVSGGDGSVHAVFDAITGMLTLSSDLGRLQIYMFTTQVHKAGEYKYEAFLSFAQLQLDAIQVQNYEYVATSAAGGQQQAGLHIQVDVGQPAQDGNVRITSLGKDGGLPADFVTGDGSMGRVVSGEISHPLGAGLFLEISTDGGQSWDKVTTFSGKRWAYIDKAAHAESWDVLVRVADGKGTTGFGSSQHVTFTTPAAAPAILRIDEAQGVLTSTEASNGVDVVVSLADTGAKAGDIVHMNWGIGLYDQVLTALDIMSGMVVVKVPAAVTASTTGGQGVLYDFNVSAAIVANGVKGAASAAYKVVGGGFSTKALADTLNVAATNVVGNEYVGNGVTVGTLAGSLLLKKAADTTSLAGLKVLSGSAGNATAVFTLDEPVTKFSVRLSGLDNTAGGAMVIVYDVHGDEIHRETVTGTLSSGRYIKAYAFTAAEGVDVGSFKVVSATNNLVVDAFSQTQALHVADSRDTQKVDGLTDSYHGSAADEVITLGYSAATYLANAGNSGIHGGAGTDTLQFAGASYVMNLNLATSAGKLTGVEIIDLTGTGNNTLTLSLKDVLENGQTDLFHVSANGTVQMMVRGNAGDVVNLDDLLGLNGPDFGDWQAGGKQIIAGSAYQVYLHSGLDAELLVQDAVKVNLI